MSKYPADRMQDPFYVGLLFQIERMMCLTDNEAKEQEVNLYDSHVKSALTKARKMVRGASPDIPESTERDQILAGLIHSLYHAPDNLMQQVAAEDGTLQEEPIKISDWVSALETVLDSIKTHNTGLPGSRGYLDFIQEFIQTADKEP